MPDAVAPVAAPILLQFSMNNTLIARGLEGLSDDDLWHQMESRGNPIAWVVGHVTETRAQMLRALGAPASLGWGGRFKRGSARIDRAEYPERDDIAAQFLASRDLVVSALQGLTPERLTEPTPVSVGGAKTVADLVAFFAFHEAYHVGQIGFIRKNLGHSALVG